VVPRPDGVLPHPLVDGSFTSPVRPGSGWPGDTADERTPVAHGRVEVVALARDATLGEVTARSSVCGACSRLVRWREAVAVEKRRSFAGEPYWGRPVPGWGEGRPRVLIVGLAPAAHGGNRTGRVFTGDRSGDWLFAALHRAGLASQPTATDAGDGLRLLDARVVAAVRCAPPANRPTPVERDTCAHWLDREVALVLPSVRSVVALGSFAWAAALRALVRCGIAVPRPRPRFSHAAELRLERRGGHELLVLGCYHPSQQNTFTGRLTERMLDDVLARATASWV
jgi:uracil-DNA glycosylase family 4